MERITKRGFASDNNSGVHPAVMKAINDVNEGHVVGYGDDPFTEEAIRILKNHFGADIDAYFVFNGTGANVLSFDAVSKAYNSIICTETSHINVDECGAPERFTGCKLLTVPTPDGKLTVEKIASHMHGFDFEHHSQPGIVSLSQATELGTVYLPEELKIICDYAHHHGLKVHMDGARICNAAASLDLSLRAVSRDAGIDVLSFGLTKNGAMQCELVIFFDQALSADFKYLRKQGMQLGSKMRFMSVQLTSLLSDDLWRQNALHSNRMAALLAEEVVKIPRVKITQKVEANGVFAVIPRSVIPLLQKEFFFYVWDESRSEVRWMTSFDTQEEDVYKFTALLAELVAR
ncbi:MAG: low specificity L-threonine aldolase [Candidatus Cloacimonetes bacterium]|nr:low specificity L-threonine aldolase [Candidatus Cloacimonadota bacterium]